MDGLIDLIITKSISRFARNTLDTISYTRKLKANGVEIYFEKENLWSLDPKSEFILTICASIAQEESRSISQNVTIAKRWSMQEGKVTMPFKVFLGFKKMPDGSIGIDEEQAKVVRLIYRMFLVEGRTAAYIARYLNEKGIPTPSQREGCKWTQQTIESILTNEKYKGDALLQKTFMVDFLEHKAKKNEGEIPSYYVENSHPHIIEKVEWEMVQAEIFRRRQLGRPYMGGSLFTSKIICEDCGATYGSKVWHSTDKYRRVIWQCNHKFDNKEKRCQTPSFSENEIKEKFMQAYNLVMLDREQMINDATQLKTMFTDTAQLDEEIEKLTAELIVVTEKVEGLIYENARLAQNQDEYNRRYEENVKEYERVKAEYDKAVEGKEHKRSQALKIECFIRMLMDAEPVLTAWNNELWSVFVESCIAHRDKTITFKFKNGKEVRV